MNPYKNQFVKGVRRVRYVKKTASGNSDPFVTIEILVDQYNALIAAVRGLLAVYDTDAPWMDASERAALDAARATVADKG